VRLITIRITAGAAPCDAEQLVALLAGMRMSVITTAISSRASISSARSPSAA